MQLNYLNSTLNSELIESGSFGSHYEGLISNQSYFAYYTIPNDVRVVLDQIEINNYPLTSFQQDRLEKIFEELINIREAIDPDLLKPFDFYYTEDEELVLFRKLNDGYVNLVINQEETISLSRISQLPDNNELIFCYSDDCIESFVLKFLADKCLPDSNVRVQAGIHS